MRSDDSAQKQPEGYARSRRRRTAGWGSWPRHAVLGALLVAALIAIGATSTASAASLADKQAEARRITAEVNRLDSQYDVLQEKYRGAQIRLADLDRELQRLDLELARTKKDLGVAENRLVQRAVAVYTQGSEEAELLNLARAGSFSKLIDRIDALRRVSKEDADILQRIKDLREAVATKKGEIADARSEQQHVVAERRSAKAAMAKRLSQRRQVLGSVTAEIRQMVAAEQARQAAAAAAAARASAANVPHAASAPAPVSPASSTDVGAALSNPAPAPPASSSAAAAAGVAMGQIGVPYKWGGADPSGFDCSGLVMYSFGQVGVSLPHSSYAQYGAGPHVSRDQLQTGDLVFFDGGGHVGIYVGGGSYVHAPHSGSSVRVDSLNDSWSSSHYSGATRVG